MRWNFAQRLSLLLLRKQMSRQQLADGVGLSRVAADKWANGESLPRANVIPRIAEFLGVPAESLDPKAESLSDPFCEFQLNGAKYLLLKTDGVLEAAEKGDLEKVVGILSNRRTPRQAEMPNEHNPLVFSVTDPRENSAHCLTVLSDWLQKEDAMFSDTIEYVPVESFVMTPTLTPDHCAVVERCRRIADAGVYRIVLHGEMVFRRVIKQAEGYLILCDNQVYPPETVDDIKVVGRVLRKMACEEVR